MLDRFPSRKAAAAIAGVDAEQLGRYVKARNKPSFDAIQRLASASGVSLEWLATGRGAMLLEDRENRQQDAAPSSTTALDEAVLASVVEALELFLARRRLSIEPARKADLVIGLYRIMSRRSDRPVAETLVDDPDLADVVSIAAPRLR
jgi:transcriptional regulator with XRE-family HTH domain